jgi:hypothetical protein
MELDKHRAILYCGFKRCRDALPALKESADYDTTYYPLWMGNWLTDMNQATAFFTVVSALGGEGWGLAEYWIAFLKKVHDIFKDEWLKRYIGKREAALKRRQRDSGQEQPDHYQSRSDGAYVVPEFIMHDAAFKKTWENLFDSLWKEEWTSAEGALDISRKMGDIQELSITAPLNAAGAAAVTTGEATKIGAYYPFDHFDVTDQYITENGERILNDREELEVKDHEERGFMSTTAKDAFEYALDDWLRKAFDATQDNDTAQTQQNRLADHQALKTLGHGLHTLQDFYAHSNYTDLLLICMAQRNLLDAYWNRRIQHLVDNTDVGTFNAFVLCKEHPDDTTGKGDRTPVVTGRFDTIDTVHTLLHLSQESILSSDEEPSRNKKEKNEALYRILFGTFSDIDVVKRFKGTVEAYLDLSGYIDDVQEKISDFFMGNLVDPFVKTILKEDKRSIDTYVLLKDASIDNKKSLVNYRKAGELLFHQHTIEDHLRKEVATAEEEGRSILPHHALLAKDYDKNNDAVKLSYKLSCSLAAEVTTEVLVKYFEGARFSEVESLLRRRYAHPQFHVETCRETDSLNKAVDALDRKWFRYALKNPQDRRSILGFELGYL